MTFSCLQNLIAVCVVEAHGIMVGYLLSPQGRQCIQLVYSPKDVAYCLQIGTITRLIGIATVANCIPTSHICATYAAHRQPANHVLWCIPSHM
jgi:hypothetical protein